MRKRAARSCSVLFVSCLLWSVAGCTGLDDTGDGGETETGLLSQEAALNPVGCSVFVPDGHWVGQYWNNTELSGSPVMTRDDGTSMGFGFNWGAGSPSAGCGIPDDNFSARWTRTFRNLSEGTYYFTTNTDDGVRLYVDGVLRLWRWNDQAPTSYTVYVNLGAGDHTIQIEYYERGGGAMAAFTWGLSPTMYQGQPVGTNLAWYATCASDTVYGYGWDCSQARDGYLGTKWTSSSYPSTHWLAYDLGANRTIDGFVVYHAGSNYEPSYFNTERFRIQSGTSLYGPWKDETTFVNSGQVNITYLRYYAPKVQRYVRLFIDDAGIDTYARIPEFQVIGSQQ